MAHALQLASWLAIGAAASLSLSRLARDLRAIPSHWRALRIALNDLEN
jgi:hypothetical protein